MQHIRAPLLAHGPCMDALVTFTEKQQAPTQTPEMLPYL